MTDDLEPIENDNEEAVSEETDEPNDDENVALAGTDNAEPEDEE
jgi:hypothetical protein